MQEEVDLKVQADPMGQGKDRVNRKKRDPTRQVREGNKV